MPMTDEQWAAIAKRIAEQALRNLTEAMRDTDAADERIEKAQEHFNVVKPEKEE